MAYDARTESLALIETRAPHPVPRLSRRRRFAAMAVDVTGDIAATMFLRRGVGCDVEETWVFARRDGHWQLLGGGGGSVNHDADLLADRPDQIPHSQITAWSRLPGVDPHLAIGGGGAGGVHDTRDGRDLFPWSGRWISYTVVLVSSRVAAIESAGRTIDIPWHGRTLVTWVGHRPPRIGLMGLHGESLATTRLPP